MLCYVCGNFIEGSRIVCRIEEGKHKGKFAYFHKKCADENLMIVKKKN